MSEYQYYEFQAVDRPLTAEEMSKLRMYSSRADITSRSFVNVYNWGDFKGNPLEWVEKHFDGFYYNSNFGRSELMLRVPGALFPKDEVYEYCGVESFAYLVKGEYGIFCYAYDGDDYEFEWEDRGRLTALLPIRLELMQGDYRALYLGWLNAVVHGEIPEHEPEPPVPPNLGHLSAAQEELVAFLRLDRDLLVAAAEGSPPEEHYDPAEQVVRAWIADLPEPEKDAMIYEVIVGNGSLLACKLQKRLREENTPMHVSSDERRNAGELKARAKELRRARLAEAARIAAEKQAEEKRKRAQERADYINSLVGQESTLWEKIDTLICRKNAAGYDAAVHLLLDLYELAKWQQHEAAFLTRLKALCQTHTKKPALMRRMEEAGLLRLIRN
ncbi:MAG TPA: hypothetical protein GXZ82_08130 [Firmicutes bacterium]|nr:hypothetical protein [Bacillota bacterium]